MRPRSEVMALRVSAKGEIRSIPSAVGGCAFCGNTMVGSEIVEKTVDVNPFEIGDGAVLIAHPSAVGQTDGAHVEWACEGSCMCGRDQP